MSKSPRYVVARGGEPTAEELAALAIALTPVVVAEPVDRPEGAEAGWARAALHEGVGSRQAVSVTDVLDLPW